jgi:hypothetical protein
MAEYFLCLDAETFLQRLRPSLGASWRQRSFTPCRSLCRELLPAAREYTRRYHTGDEETLVERIAEGLPFDRACWRLLAGEMLLFAAVEIPEFPTNAETLCCLLDSEASQQKALCREQYTPIQQALHGSREVTFGSAVYRPDRAGYNALDDVARLADYLAAVEPDRWNADMLRALPELEDADDRADELAFAREWFPVLVELYRRARAERWIVVIESIY